MRLNRPFLFSCVFSFVFVCFLTSVMKLMSSPPKMKTEKQIKTDQIKQGVVKEVYLTQNDGTFLHEYLSAKTAVFKFVKNKKKTDFIENLEGISAVFEEMVQSGGKSIKQIRSLQADSGTWFYMQNRLLAEKANLSIVETQKTGLKPLFQGRADRLDLKLENGKPQFVIEGFKAKLQKDKP